MNAFGRRDPVVFVAAVALTVAVLALSARGTTPPSAGATPMTDPGIGLRSRIDAARSRLLAHYRDVDAKTGLADILENRLDADESMLFVAGKPANASTAVFWDWNAAIVALDESLVEQLVGGTYHSLAAVRGLDDVPIASSPAGHFIPCAIDVPPSYSVDKPAPLVVLLHGKGVSEAAELADPVYRGLSADTGAIVIAPFARGDDLRSPSAAADVYSAVDAAEAALSVDRRHVYLVGDSMGGYAAFDIAPVRPSVWTALLAVASTMDPADQQTVKDHLHGKPIYIVAGDSDATVPVNDIRRSVIWFRSIGLATSYYEGPNAGDDILALAPLVKRAWRDMLSGVKSLQPVQLDIPDMTPAPSQKP